MLKNVKSYRCVSIKRPLSYPLYELMVKYLEVCSHKVLGLVIQDNLKWNEQICMIVSKHLHIICVLCRSGVIAADLVAVYVVLACSVLEYCFVV